MGIFLIVVGFLWSSIPLYYLIKHIISNKEKEFIKRDFKFAILYGFIPSIVLVIVGFLLDA